MLLIFVMFLALAHTAQASDFSILKTASSLPRNTGEVLVVLKDNPDRRVLPRIEGVTGVHWLLSDEEITPRTPEIFRRVVVAKTTRERVRSIAKRMEENHIIKLNVDEFPNDPMYLKGDQDYLRMIGVEKLWEQYKPTGGPATVRESAVGCVVVDSGILSSHPDLEVDLQQSRSFFEGLSPFEDPGTTDYPQGHGTFIAGIIGGKGNNGIGISGVSWGTRCVSFRVFKPVTYTNLLGQKVTTLVTGYEEILKAYIALHDLSFEKMVVNSSFSYDAEALSDPTLMEETMKSLEDRALFVVAAGNTRNGIPQYPAVLSKELANVIAVGSIDKNRRLSSFSSFGPWVNIVAPGENICSTAGTGGYACPSGTSLSTPLVGGVAKATWDLSPNLTPRELGRIILAGGQFNPYLGDLIENPISLNVSGALRELARFLNGEPSAGMERTEVLAMTSDFSNSRTKIPRGGVVTLWGRFTGGEECVFESFPLPKRLCNVEVLLNGIPVPLFYVGPTQVNLHVPMDFLRLWSGENKLVAVELDGEGNSLSWSAAQVFRPVEVSPSFVTLEDNDELFVEVQEDRSRLIFATGLGVTTPQVSAGYLGKGELVKAKVTALVNGEPLAVVARASDRFPGLYEILIPPLPESDEISITFVIGEQTTTFTMR